jgi:hypothetical protein
LNSSAFLIVAARWNPSDSSSIHDATLRVSTRAETEPRP